MASGLLRVLILTLFLGSACTGSPHLAGPSGVQGSPSHLRAAPSFSLQDASGALHQLSEFDGHPAVIHFWASWCAPCLDELPELLSRARANDGKPIVWVAISLDRSWAPAQKVLKEQQMPSKFLSLLDEKQKASDDYGSYQFPETYLLNSRHEIVEKLVGSQDWSRPELQAKIDHLL